MKGRMSRSSGIEGLRDCVICVSGFSNETTPSREQVKNLIDMVGGCYMGPLCRNYTTHLVCLNYTRWVCCEEVMGSDKVTAAREWGDTIRVVSVEWLLACVREWRRVKEEGFAVKEVNEDDVETGDEEVEGNEELEGSERVEGSEKLEEEKKEEEMKKKVEEERLRREEEERKKKEEEEKERLRREEEERKKKEEEEKERKKKEEEKKQKEEKKEKEKKKEMKEEEKHSQKRNPSLPPPNPKKPNTTTTP